MSQSDQTLASQCDKFDIAIDWDALVYTGTVPQSLFCPVCKNVLLSPLQTSCEYKHTLCARCITRALDERLECPVDRSPMPEGFEECNAAPVLIQQVLDELEVECPNNGCTRKIARFMVSAHMREGCDFQAVPCSDVSCDKFSLRHESNDSECPHQSVQCEHCLDKIMVRDHTAHLDECSALSHQCPFCHDEFDVKGIRSHREVCPSRPTQCPSSAMGCTWSGIGEELEAHISACTINMMRPWLEEQRMRVTTLEVENRLLRDKLDNFTKAEDKNEDVIEVSSGYERDRNYLFQTLETLSNGLESLSTSITAMDNKNNHVTMSESLRTKEEIAMLRGGLQALRLQWHHFVQNTRGPLIHGTADFDKPSDRTSSARTSPTRSQNGDGSRVKL